MVDRFESKHHRKPLILGYDRLWFMLHILFARNNHMEFIAKRPRFFQIEEVARMDDIKGAGGNDTCQSDHLEASGQSITGECPPVIGSIGKTDDQVA